MKSVRLILISSFLSTSAATAMPAMNQNCSRNIQIKAPKTGSGVYFDRDCRVAYVLPPTQGSIKIDAIAQSAMLGNCSYLNDQMEIFAERSKQLVKLVKDGGKKPSKKKGGSVLFPEPEEPETPADNEAIADEIKKLRAEFLASFDDLKDLWAIPGASAQFTYNVGHQALVEEYQKLNPKYTFRPITLKEAKIKMARRFGNGDAAFQLPMVLSSELPGITLAGQDEEGGVVGGEGQSSQIVLSLAGACPYYNSSTKKMVTKLSAKELNAQATANLAYVYELQSLKKYEAKYNLGAFIRRVQSSESKGGFFSSKTVNRLIEEEKTHDWFEITTYTEDGRDVYDAGFSQMIKAQIVDRALRNIALFINGESVAAPQQTQPGPNGATVAAKELRKCPHLYCQVAAGVLDVANAIFGKSTSVAEYVKTHDTWVTETESTFNMMSFVGTVPFNRDGE